MSRHTKTYDFEGWATKFDVKCADGRTIRHSAFVNNNGKRVPLVWMHQHGSVMNVLGHADLEQRDEGVWARGTFNDTEQGQAAKQLVQHGDITCLSIWANHLRQTPTKDVLHGDIKELSLVLAGANPEAIVEDIIEHSEEGYDEYDGTICSEIPFDYVSHDDEDEDFDVDPEEDSEDEDDSEEVEHADVSEKEDTKVAEEKTVQDILDTMNEEQLKVTKFLVGSAYDDGKNDSDKNGGDEEMKHSVFDNDDILEQEDTLTHDDMVAVLGDVKRYGTLKESALAHGIENLEVLFPEAKAASATPEFIKREMTWVDDVMNGVHKVPFARIKSLFADITEDEARAKGYIKGKYKKEEVFSLLKRTTQPTTIYKKQKFDRDDIVDITDFDVVAWIKQEMRMMLNEEIARAILVGDGRLASDDDHIDTNCLRPIWTEEELFVVNTTLDASVDITDEDAVAKNFIRKAVKSRKNYKGSGRPTLFTTEDMLTDMLLLTDNEGRDLYDSEEKLRNKLRVAKIVTVPVMEGLTRSVNGQNKKLLGIIVNLADYSYGADKGGAVSLFDDFDIDYNQQKYLIETRGSGSLVKPFSAIVIEANVANG
jgi:HK97 family phage prohead protease